jgi:hypothetical protein
MQAAQHAGEVICTFGKCLHRVGATLPQRVLRQQVLHQMAQLTAVRDLNYEPVVEAVQSVAARGSIST